MSDDRISAARGIDPGLLLAPVFVVLWSTGFIGAKYGLPYVEPGTFLAIRFWLVVVCFALWVVATRAPWPSGRQWLEAALIGVLLHVLYLGGVFWAIDRGTEAGVAALIVGLQPILTAILARVWLAERLVAAQWLGMALGFGGVTLVVLRKLGEGIGDWPGVWACVLALASIAVASLIQKTRGKDHPMRSATLVQFAAAGIVVTPLALMVESNRVVWSGELIFAMAWLVLVLSVGAVMLLYVLIRRGGASTVASLFFLVPASTALIAWALFDETLGPVALAGVAMAAVGVMIVNRPALLPGASRGRERTPRPPRGPRA